jgi:ArsR family transcriptional regulator
MEKQFYACRRLLTALGDETRQLIIAVLSSDCERGLQVGEIAAKVHLSRPAVSHHLKILLDSEVVGLRKQATKHFYSLRLGGEWQTLVSLVGNIEKLRAQCAREGKKE